MANLEAFFVSGGGGTLGDEAVLVSTMLGLHHLCCFFGTIMYC